MVYSQHFDKMSRFGYQPSQPFMDSESMECDSTIYPSLSYPPQQESTYPPAIRYANRIPQQMSDPLYPEFANSDPTWPQSIPSTIPTQPYWLSPSLGPGFSDSNPVSFPTYSDTIVAAPETCTSGFLDPDPMLSPHLARRASRATSFASNASSTFSHSHSDASGEATSPSAHEMSKWGIRNANGSWSCAFPGCASRSLFHRGCDLRKHYKRHTKSLFCRHKGCLQATEGGFSSKKDRARHEAKHDPKIGCEWEGCGRIFSRMDNMVSYKSTSRAVFWQGADYCAERPC